MSARSETDMPIKDFRGVSLKKELIDSIEKFIRDHPEAGYKSASDMVQEAVRLRFQEIKKIYGTTAS